MLCLNLIISSHLFLSLVRKNYAQETVFETEMDALFSVL